MPGLVVENSTVRVVLSRREKLGALRFADLVFPMSAVASVQRLSEASKPIKGLRMPGTSLPGLVWLGTWRSRNSRTFVAISRKHDGYFIKLNGEKFDQLAVSSASVPELEALVES